VVRFDFEGFTGTSTTLVGSIRPFVLKEFNTDDDIYKPIRPQMAEMSFIASVNGVSIDDFLMNNDDDVIVYFDFGSWTNYWIGYMLQDDFQETWIDTDHIITLRATEGLGQLKDIELTDAGDELNGRYTPLEIIQLAMVESVKDFSDYRVFSNLFHSSMTDTSTNTGIDQCYVDAKTFMINPSEYDNSYDALEKVNKSWNQAIYMYYGKWVIFRMEELYVPFGTNFRGYRNLGGTRTAINARYDAEVGVDETIKPISPEMLRFIQRRTKSDTIQFNFQQFDEVVCNGSFSRGSLVSSSSTIKIYNLDQWTWQTGTFASPTTPTTGSYGRAESLTASGSIEDAYAFIVGPQAALTWIKSCGTQVIKNERINFSVETRYKDNFAGNSTYAVCAFMLFGNTNNYTLDDDGKWYQSNATWTVNFKLISQYYNGTPAVSPIEWLTTSVISDTIPENGTLYILLLYSYDAIPVQQKWFKNLQVKVATTFNGYDVETIDAVQSIFTKTDTLKPKFYDEIYFDDGLSKLYKGSLYEDDQETLTTADWHRFRFPSESYGFRKQNDITHWEHNRYNRNKIDANFYGLTWSGGTQPIGLINTVKFVDDSPNRVYAIANLKEIDFSSSVWSATLVEVFNSDIDATGGLVPRTLSLVAAGGVSIQYVSWSVINLADFTHTINYDKFTFNGSTAITTTITCTLEGYSLITTSTPITVDIYLKKNSTILNTQSFSIVYNPTTFNVTLTTASVTINPGDQIYVEMDSDLLESQITGGTLQINYDATTSVVFDPYQDKYIYK
jgi:hypothetical protein